ncbi:hypothetical protein IAT38_002213 [Cryptococcus sp. DSM 104549]
MSSPSSTPLSPPLPSNHRRLQLTRPPLAMSANSNLPPLHTPSSSAGSVPIASKSDGGPSSSTPTLAFSPPDVSIPSSSTPPPTSSKLKGLSLVGRPTSLDLDRERPASATCRGATTPGPATPVSGGVRRARGAVLSMRSSISYSPASGSSPRPSWGGGADRSGEDGDRIGLGLGMESEKKGPAARSSMDKDDGSGSTDPKGKRDTQTFTEKHADLLTMIAQKERRVNELRQELQSEESALAQLQSRFTALASRATRSPDPSSSTTSGRRARPTSMALSSASISTSSTASLATIDEPQAGQNGMGIENVLNGLITHTEGYLNPEVVEGGKRFLGTLWKTVGAAAGGTVPEHQRVTSGSGGTVEEEGERDEWGNFSPKIDLSGLQRIITPWSTPSQPTKTSPSGSTRPRNLPNPGATPTSGSSSGSNRYATAPLKESPNFLDDDATPEFGKALTPAKAPLSASSRSDGGKSKGSDDGWGEW